MTVPAAPALDPRILRLLIEGPTATVFVPVPGGEFNLGSRERADEQPLRHVRVRPIEAALTPVTNAEYAHYLDATGHEPPKFWDDPRFNTPECPVVGISWTEAAGYCSWLSTLLGRPCRLPTEAEREWAARGGTTTRYPWGDEPWTEGIHGLGAAGNDRPHVVGTTPPNGYGLYHMGDNVHEWCSDWYSPKAYDSFEGDTVEDPQYREETARRSSRGGSWRHHVKVSRVAARSSLSPDFQYNDYGFRVYAESLSGSLAGDGS
jgi:iron(II)-dependent oxidoreductase